MASFTTGYYVPTSMSQSYVSSKRDEEGTLKYQGAEQELGIQKQAALQSLEKNYATTIENAYASYLANQRGINTSAMGQGYKEIYKQAQEQQLLSNIAEANMNLANTRAEISANIAEAQENIQAQKAQEVSNLNRVQGAMTQYLQYVKSLTGEAGEMALSEEDQSKNIDELYETLFELSPKTLTDESGAQGLGFVDWIRTKLTGSEADTAWGDWLFGGGLADFRAAVAKTKAIETNKSVTTEKKPYNEKALTNDTIDTVDINTPIGVSTRNVTIKSDFLKGESTDIKKGDTVEAINSDGKKMSFIANGSIAYQYSAIANNISDKIDINNLKVNTIIKGKYENQYYMYIGKYKNSPRFISLKSNGV